MSHFSSPYVIPDFHISQLSYGWVLKHSAAFVSSDKRGFNDIQPISIHINEGVFTNPSSQIPFPSVVVSQVGGKLELSCACQSPKARLCEHQIQVLLNILNKPQLKVFFDEELRLQMIKEAAKEYGLENEPNVQDLFGLEYGKKALEIKPLQKEVFPVTADSEAYLKEHLLPKETESLPFAEPVLTSKRIVVFAKHKYYEHFVLELFEASTTKEGKIKAPLSSIDPLDTALQTEQVEEAKFYSAISKFQHKYESGKSQQEVEALRALVKNPLGLEFFYHDAKLSEKISPSSLVPIQLRTLPIDLRLSVDLKEKFHEVTGQLLLNDQPYELRNLQVKFNYFVLINGTLYFIDHPDFLRVLEFFKRHHHKLLIHTSKFEEFRQTILSPLENKVRISYSHIRPATEEELEELEIDTSQTPIIYLSESQQYVVITPVMRYGKTEVPILSRKQMYGQDPNGNLFTILRDEDAEILLTALLMRQHPHFGEYQGGDSFYLHRERFLENDWFLEAFEEWQHNGITVLGFKELKSTRYNPHKAKVSVRVTTGISWFETSLEVSYGKEKVELKHLHKSIRNKNKFVQLGDGSLGILPQEWIEKMAAFFEAGEIKGETIRMSRHAVASLSELYEEKTWGEEVKEQVRRYHRRLAEFERIREVEVPNGLKATLRAYQKQGLHWLHFLEEFGFGGCLADDMGLGKTIQVIAFLLSLKEKKKNTHLVVVPTSLISNWQNEIAQFAPSLRVHTLYGAQRHKHSDDFGEYDIVLTTYGMMLSDIHYLKNFRFGYAILDESQAIKNPDSLRYQAACLLQSENRLVLTGTPIENNTFDLYGQFSFACPGLLGSKQYFKDIYSTPIDQFGDYRRAKELQRKIHPFLLRRTKSQVATELPEKTEMIVYCEMGPEQRKVYNAYEKELREYIATKREERAVKDSMYVLKGITKLRQICDSTALVKEAFYGDSSCKVEALMEQIESKSPEHKILVFSQFVSMLDLIKKELTTKGIPFEYLTGQSTKRADKVASFQQNEGIRVFLISLKAGGVGLNLTEADYVYLVDPWWNPAVENQAIDRSYRIGQTKHVIAVRLICQGTIEEKIQKLQASKKELANDLIKTDAAILKSLSKKELEGLFI